jgi:hypothetical protein
MPILALALLLAPEIPVVERDVWLPRRTIGAMWPRIYDAWVAEPQYEEAMVRGRSLVVIPRGTTCRLVAVNERAVPASAVVRLKRGEHAGKDLWIRLADIHAAPRTPTP